MPVDEWLPAEVKEALETYYSGASWSEINPMEMTIGDQNYQLIGHDCEEYLILEFEEVDSSEENDANFHRKFLPLSQLFNKCESIYELANTAAHSLKKLTAYDRVMVYRFDVDWHGEVIGEAKEDHLEPFLGLHYPATDIPLPARRLFLINGQSHYSGHFHQK